MWTSRGGFRICVPCLVCISSMASAFCFCHLTHQRTKVSVVAERIASCCWAGRLVPHLAC